MKSIGTSRDAPESPADSDSTGGLYPRVVLADERREERTEGAWPPPGRDHRADDEEDHEELAERQIQHRSAGEHSAPPGGPGVARLKVVDVVIGLGSNLGDRREAFRFAVRGLADRAAVTRASALYETDAVGAPGPAFLNAAVLATWAGTPRDVLDGLLDIERRFGRVRRERWGPRTLDLDLLWIRDRSVAERELTVPHARLRERRFALAPLLDVAPDARDPASGEALSSWLAALPGTGVRRIGEADWATGVTPAK